MTEEQLHLVDSIHLQARMLSGMLNTLLLVARIDDGSYQARKQDLYLYDFLISFLPVRELFPETAPRIECSKDILLHADRRIVEFLFESIMVILGAAAHGDKVLSVTIKEQAGECHIEFQPHIELSFFRESADIPDTSAPKAVGGMAGLMLSMTRSLTGALGGQLEVRKTADDHYALALRLPTKAAASFKKIPSAMNA